MASSPAKGNIGNSYRQNVPSTTQSGQVNCNQNMPRYHHGQTNKKTCILNTNFISCIPNTT